MPRLLVDISAHGYGHLAQTAPVLADLRRARPEIELTVRTALPAVVLARRIGRPFVHLPTASDFGFVMHNAIEIDVAASVGRYRALHADWPERVAAEAARLRALAPDLVLANAAYLPLAGAAAAGIAAVGLCSLNWADLFATFHGGETWAVAAEQEMIDAYASARAFLRVTPGLPMPRLGNRREIGPIARVADRAAAASRRERVGTALGLPTNAKWGLLAMGGMDFRVAIETWVADPRQYWICPAAWKVAGANLRDFDDARLAAHGLTFFDLLTSADVVLTKPGYGTFAEAVCNGVPLLYLPRGNWAEEAPMVGWARRNGRIDALPQPVPPGFDPRQCLERLWSDLAPSPPLADGAAEAAEIIGGLLRDA